MMIVMFHVALMPPLEMSERLKFITNFGGFGVPLFYILSAFALSYGYVGKLDTSDQVRRFYVRRFWRIAPLFYLMMVYYVGYLWVAAHHLVSVQSLLTSATFTFNLLPQHVTGFVFASWSIGVEMLFYAIFPVLVLLNSSLKRAVVIFAASVFVVIIWTEAFAGTEGNLRNFGSFSIVGHLHYFAGGMLAFFIWQTVRWTPMLHRLVTAAATAFLVSLIFVSQYLMQWMPHPALTAVWAVGLMALVLGLSFERASAPLWFAVRLGEASFSLYLLHPAIIALMIHSGVYKWLYSVVPGHFLGYTASLGVTLAVLFPLSLLTYEQVEKRFHSGQGLPWRRRAADRTEVVAAVAVDSRQGAAE